MTKGCEEYFHIVTGFTDVRGHHFCFMKMRLSTKTKANGYVYIITYDMDILDRNGAWQSYISTPLNLQSRGPRCRDGAPPPPAQTYGESYHHTNLRRALSMVLTQEPARSGSLVDQGLCPRFCPSDCILPTYSRRNCDEPKWQEYSISENIN